MEEFTKERKQAQIDVILATPAIWNVACQPLSLTHSMFAAAAAASGLCTEGERQTKTMTDERQKERQ